MVKLRPLDTIKGKWKNRASAAAGDYKFGIENPLEDWATNASAAESAWEGGVQDAISRKAFSKGVKAAGTAKWQERALKKGVRRYPEGVAIAEDDYAKGFEPYYNALSRVTLPPRGPRGDPRNLERVRVIVETLRKVKTGSSTTATK